MLTHTKKKLCAQCARKLSASNVPKQMAETNFSLFADSCATSCNKKSMNQGQSIYSNNKDREICHFPTLPLFSFFFFDENMPFFFSRRTRGWGWWGLGWESPTCTHKQSAQSLKKKKREKSGGKMPAPPNILTKRNLKRRHLTVTNQIRSVIEFSISAKLIRKRKHNNSKWHISEGGDFKEQHQGTPDASSR